MVSENLKKAVSEGDLLRVRAIMLRQINSDREMEKFDLLDSCSYAEPLLRQSGTSLFVADDGKSEFSDDKASWNMELWQSMRIEFEYNFSKEKLEHTVLLMEHLRATGHPEFQVKRSADARVDSNYGGGQEGSVKKSAAPRESNLVSKIGTEQSSGLKNNRDISRLLTNGLVGALVGGVAGSFLRATAVGAIVGAICGVALVHSGKGRRDQ